MNESAQKYRGPILGFLHGDISAKEFQRIYLETFKNEVVPFDESTYGILDSLFGDVDAFTEDQGLLAENPSYFLNEVALRERVSQVAHELQAIWDRLDDSAPPSSGLI